MRLAFCYFTWMFGLCCAECMCRVCFHVRLSAEGGELLCAHLKSQFSMCTYKMIDFFFEDF